MREIPQQQLALPADFAGNLPRVLRNITDGVAFVRSGAVAWANEPLARLCGMTSPGELVGKPVDALFADVGAGLPDVEAFGAVECGLRRPDGELGPVEVCVSRGAGEDGAGDEIWTVRDRARQRDLEEELYRVSRALHDTQREIETLRERLSSEGDDRDALLGVVSHELRTPLTVIHGFNRLLLSGEAGPLSDRQRHFLEESARSCLRLDQFVKNLLESARAGRDVLDLSEGSLGRAIQEVVRFLRPLLDGREQRIEISLESESDAACFDAARVERVLVNLLVNAIRFTPPGGTLRVGTCRVETQSARFVEVSVEDEGPGVAAEDRERIFEPYVRGEDAPEGLGLGLAICRRIVEAHGGVIRVEALRRGSRFAFTLPAGGSR